MAHVLTAADTDLYREREQPELAIPCWEQILALSPDDEVGAYIGLGCALQDEGRLAEAMSCFREAEVLQPGSAAVRSNIGSLFEIMGEMSEAEEYRRLMEHWVSTLSVMIHHVDYEETVSDLEGVARRLLSAAGLQWDPACLEFYRNQRAVRTASITRVRQPIYRSPWRVGGTTSMNSSISSRHYPPRSRPSRADPRRGRSQFPRPHASRTAAMSFGTRSATFRMVGDWKPNRLGPTLSGPKLVWLHNSRPK